MNEKADEDSNEYNFACFHAPGVEMANIVANGLIKAEFCESVTIFFDQKKIDDDEPDFEKQ
jgi:hypothetical protein